MTHKRGRCGTGRRWPAIDKAQNDLVLNEKRSIEVWFSPESPVGYEKNRVRTVPGDNGFTILRTDGPRSEWVDDHYDTGEITRVG